MVWHSDLNDSKDIEKGIEAVAVYHATGLGKCREGNPESRRSFNFEWPPMKVHSIVNDDQQ
jgi:hypothetical protein